MSRDVDNYYRAVGTYRDNTLDEYFATIASAIISKSFDIIALRDSDFKEVPPFPFKFLKDAIVFFVNTCVFYRFFLLKINEKLLSPTYHFLHTCFR